MPNNFFAHLYLFIIMQVFILIGRVSKEKKATNARVIVPFFLTVNGKNDFIAMMCRIRCHIVWVHPKTLVSQRLIAVFQRGK